MKAILEQFLYPKVTQESKNAANEKMGDDEDRESVDSLASMGMDCDDEKT